ncbi:MAG: aspartyl/asparaginyl beta-hydroxylase domain-containing protein [Cyclobacteriaceae bacterium]|nr:aspartyl/asparaginyl beta-hydroxylase domain-containing protein [Cyclobacteriaceae bacterium]
MSLRTHLGIHVPENCGIWVEGEKKKLNNNKFITFDDSKFHSAYNQSNEDRIVLIFDIPIPPFLRDITLINLEASILEAFEPLIIKLLNIFTLLTFKVFVREFQFKF